MAKTRRGKKSRKGKGAGENSGKESGNAEEMGDSASGETLGRTFTESLHLNLLLTPASPQTRSDIDTSTEENDDAIFETAGRHISKHLLSSPISIFSPDNCIYETPKTSFRKLRFDAASPIEYADKNPLASPLRARSSPNFENAFLNPFAKKTIHFSTPKEFVVCRAKTETDLLQGYRLEEDVSKQSLASSIHSFSVILKNEAEAKVSRTCLTPLPPVVIAPSKKVFGRIRRCGRDGIKWPASLIDFCTWFGITIKKVSAVDSCQIRSETFGRNFDSCQNL